MARGTFLTESERSTIIKCLASGETALQISKKLGRDPRTVKSFTNDPSRKTPLSTSKRLFEEAGIPMKCKTTRCRVLKSIASVKKPRATPLLTTKHRQARLRWAWDNIKREFGHIIWTDEARATLDGPDGWSRGWITHHGSVPGRTRRQHGGGGVMFWAGIVSGELIGPFRVAKGVKMDSKEYCKLLDQTLIPWYRQQPLARRKKLVLMQDNAPSHCSQFSKESLRKKGIGEAKILPWPSNSPDLNVIENLWSFIKQDIYGEGRQYSTLDELWSAIERSAREVPKSFIEKLCDSIDSRLRRLIARHGGHNGEQLRCEGSFSLLRPHEHVIPSTTVSEVDEEYSNAVTLRKDDMKTTISSSSRGRGNRTETDDTSIEDDEEEDDVRQGRRQQQQHRRKSGIDIDDDTPESGGGSTSSSPRSKRRRRRRIIQEGEDDDDEDEEDDDDVEMGYDIKDGNIDDDDEDDDSSSIAGSRMSKGVEDVDYDGDNKKTKNTKKEEEKVEEYMMKDDETVEAAVEASSSSQPQVVEANSSTTAAAAVGVVGDGVEEGSIVGPKIRKRGRLVTAGPLGIIEDNKIEEVEEDIQLKEVEKEDGDGEREDDIDDDDKLPIMPLV
ncbi:hypothetical protein FOL47_006992 [Perkinsus chesapeaki]|uniref:Tc1-like transposase DDE domain-containing protein n=1 Tax=Perkinsus chesapeaki TaxID=330153 RepID=A0A7J6N3K8_PERCH|nr:hypothetical protein FOL47_006992 [Perkinsus chesapeaki]